LLRQKPVEVWEAAMKHPKRANIVNWSMFLLVIVLCFVAGEWVLRALPVSDRMGANLVPTVEERVENAGHRSKYGTRILVLGDSFTEWRDTTGENYARIAQRVLRKHYSDPDMINLGEGGTGLFDYFSNLVRYGDTLNPDLVVLGIYLGNDLVASRWPIGSAPSLEAALREPRSNNRENGVTHLLKQSIAFNYMFRVAKQFLPALRSDHFDRIVASLEQHTGRDGSYVSQRLAMADPKLVDEAKAETINVWDLAIGIFFPSYYSDLALAAAGTPAGRSVDGFLRDLAGVIAYCREKRYPVAVVLIPPCVWVSERYHSYFHRLGYTDLGPVSGAVPVIEKVKAALVAQGVPTLDLLPILRSARDEIFIENDIHFNRAGHEVAGQALARLLFDAELLPARANQAALKSRSSWRTGSAHRLFGSTVEW
jgi:SGNH hydrolase-like domain, acetyltransferase AlgX